MITPCNMLFTTRATSIFRLSANLPLKKRVLGVAPPAPQLTGLISIFQRHNSNHTANPQQTTRDLGHGISNSEKIEHLKETLAAKQRMLKLQPKQKVFTIPNILTMSRIAATPAIGYFICNGMNHEALMCFAFAATTDLLDGIIARKFNQYTDLGAILDPIADKLLLATCFISMYQVNLMPLWLIKGYILRDIIILAGGATMRYFGFGERPSMRKFLDFQNHPTLGFEPTFASKCNTAIQCALICYHLGFGFDRPSWLLFGVHAGSALLASFSLAQYLERAFSPHVLQKVTIPKGWK